jgi:glycosyltransferase involved in cell wall biosynthesis
VNRATQPDRLPGTRALELSRVGIDVRYLQRRGIGISRYVEQGVSEILEAGAHVTLITDNEGHADALRTAFPSAGTVCLTCRSGFLWEQRHLPRHLAIAGYDAYIAPGNYGLPLAYRGPTVLILIVHDLIPLRLGHLYLPRRPLWAVKYLLSTAIAATRADQVIAPSYATARDITRLLRRRNVAVAYPRIPSSGTAAGKGTVLPGPLIDAASGTVKPYFAYNGGADIRKNVPTLLRAFGRVRQSVPAMQLVMIGPGQDYFRYLISRLGLAGHVHALGYVDEATKNAILHSAMALIYPSRMEGFGLPILDAMAAGIPAVCGTGGSLAEVGGEAVTYVSPINDESLAAAMLSVTDEAARERAKSASAAQLQFLLDRQQAGTLAGIVAAATARRRPYSKRVC